MSIHRRHFTAALAGMPALLRSTSTPAAAPDAATALAALAERHYEAQARFDPVVSATMLGDNRFDDQLPIGIAPAERQRRFAAVRGLQQALSAIDRQRLGARDRLTHDVLAHELRTRLGFAAFDDHLLPLQQMNAVPLLLATFATGQAEQPMATVTQREAYLKRIGALPAWVVQALANLREGRRRGIVLPRPVAVATLKQLKALGDGDAARNPFLAPVRAFPADFSDGQRSRLTAAYHAAVLGRIAPAMRRLADSFERDYLPVTRTTAGWGALPSGADWYRQWVRDQTTTTLEPERIHTVGLEEVARLQAQIERLAPALGHAGDPRQLLAWVRTQPRFLPFRSETEVLEAYRRIDASVRAQLPRFFGRLPKARLEIRPEPGLTKATASDHYKVPAEDGSRPGVFWAVINDPAAYDATTMTALFLHEGHPGHHTQMALQQELALPAFRQRAWINAYGEGWALYAETLGHEMGLYDDPAAMAGHLRMAIFRAARLVIDTGLHARGWSADQAVAYLMDTAGFNDAQARNQVLRYMAWPGQALGYTLGALTIRRLRDEAQARLGGRFRLPDFHDAVLGEGPLPLAVLEAHIGRWIEARKPAA
jgi:uncharacterized protein (DUF885 family)